MQSNNKFIWAKIFIALLLTAQTAFAVPTIISEEDQTFNQNQSSTQLRNITITEDLSAPYIKSGTLKISIPDAIDIIFDQKSTKEHVTLYGTAVTSGKIAESPEISFSNGDKTLEIPVIADFSAGEQVVVTKVYVEGFNTSPSASTHFYMQINDGVEQYKDAKDIYVQTSSYEDTNGPDVPTNITLTNSNGGVLVQWTDPTDLDLQAVEILRGIGTNLVSGTPYTSVAYGIEEYLDTDVTAGETVNYVLRATDGKNPGVISETYTTTYDTTDTGITEDTGDDATGNTDSDIDAGSTGDDTNTGDDSTDEHGYGADVSPEDLFEDGEDVPTWASTPIVTLVHAGIIEGNDDGTFAPAASLNRAEAAAMLWRVLMLGDPSAVTLKPFSDVELTEWFAPFVAGLKDLDLIEGNPDGTYQPGEYMNRAEFVTLALRVYVYLHADQADAVAALQAGDTTAAYTDLDTEAWYADEATAATSLGFVSGSDCEGGKCFNADSEINRAEASNILYNMFYAE